MTNLQEKPVTKNELLESFKVRQMFRQETSWVKHLEFTDTNSGERYRGRLRWNENDGYVMFWDNKLPDNLTGMWMRPEFEYVLDSYTEDIYNV